MVVRENSFDDDVLCWIVEEDGDGEMMEEVRVWCCVDDVDDVEKGRDVCGANAREAIGRMAVTILERCGIVFNCSYRS